MEEAVAYSVVLCHHLQPATQQHHEKLPGSRQMEHSKRQPGAMSTQIQHQRTSAGLADWLNSAVYSKNV